MCDVCGHPSPISLGVSGTQRVHVSTHASRRAQRPGLWFMVLSKPTSEPLRGKTRLMCWRAWETRPCIERKDRNISLECVRTSFLPHCLRPAPRWCLTWLPCLLLHTTGPCQHLRLTRFADAPAFLCLSFPQTKIQRTWTSGADSPRAETYVTLDNFNFSVPHFSSIIYEMFCKSKFNQRDIPGLMYYPFQGSLLVEGWGWCWKEVMINPKKLMSKNKISIL